MKNEKTPNNKQKDCFEEVINTVCQTVTSKGWYFEIKSSDEHWKYATIYVVRKLSDIVTEGSFDITVDNGVKVSLNVLTPFNPQGLDD